MRRTCKYCGIVDENHICPYRKDYRRPDNRPTRGTEQQKFRSSIKWERKRKEIKERDRYLCRVCFAGVDCEKHFTFDGLEVHHITPLIEDASLRLENDNLITLCQVHHKRAENGTIPRNVLFELAKTPPEGQAK